MARFDVPADEASVGSWARAELFASDFFRIFQGCQRIGAKIFRVSGTVDVREPRAYFSTARQSSRQPKGAEKRMVRLSALPV
jgi:hypothetical protein